MAWTPGNNTPWPDTWVAVLKLMYPKGYSASAIATQINSSFRGANLSRNAVIGKIGRLGLERDEAFNRLNRAAARGGLTGKRTPTGAIIPGPSPLPPRPLAEPARADGEHIDLFEITAKTCCWPINAGRPQWLFCGQPRDPKSGPESERGYCTAHWRKSIGRAA
jgi:hypothetical protein